MTKQAQLILKEIAARYDQDYADHVWSLADRNCPSSKGEYGGLLQLVALYQVMGEEGFSPSERGAIFADLLQSVTGHYLSAKAWAEVLNMPVYGTSSFSPEVREELRQLSNLVPLGNETSN